MLDPKRLVALERLGMTCEQIALALALESGIVASASTVCARLRELRLHEVAS